jgi:hypothetical protein
MWESQLCKENLIEMVKRLTVVDEPQETSGLKPKASILKYKSQEC